MTKTRTVLAVLVALSVAFFGCKTEADEEDSSIGAPSVSAPEELAASGGTVPSTETAAITLFTDSMQATELFPQRALHRIVDTGKLPYDDDRKRADQYQLRDG